MRYSNTQRSYLQALSELYVARTRGSQRQREAAWPHLADGRSSQGFFSSLPEAGRERWLATKSLRHPLVGARSEGARVWDIDANEYVDFCLGFGVHLFGHRPPFVEAALREQLELGLPIGYQSARANEVAEAVAALTGHERVSLCNTGAEAVMGALRLARAATGRDTIAVFRGSYHGSHGSVLPSVGKLHGVAQGQLDDTLVLEYGAAHSLELIAEQAGSLAAVLVEPVQARNPGLVPVDFLRELRKLTAAKGIALIFDDVLLGFRIHAGGSEAYFDIRADITTYGKILGGGLPIGVIAGSARYLDALDGGRWSATDDTEPHGDKVWLAGTFSKNPLTMAAASAVCQRLLDAGPALQAGLNTTTAALCARLNHWLIAESMPFELVAFGSLFRLVGPAELWPIMAELRMRGVFAFDGMVFFLSTAHGDAELETFESVLKDSLVHMRRAGFIPQAESSR